MALQSEELFGSSNSQPQTLRAYPAEDGVVPAQLEQLGADAEVAHLTPLVFSSGTWGVWQDLDGSTVTGFLWAPVEPHQGLAAGETLIQVMKAGVIHYDDIPLPASQTQATLDTALQAQSLRDAGIRVQGLDGVA